MANCSSPSATPAWESPAKKRAKSSMHSLRRRRKARAWGWRLRGPSLKHTEAACGPRPTPIEAQLFISFCRPEVRRLQCQQGHNSRVSAYRLESAPKRIGRRRMKNRILGTFAAPSICLVLLTSGLLVFPTIGQEVSIEGTSLRVTLPPNWELG